MKKVAKHIDDLIENLQELESTACRKAETGLLQFATVRDFFLKKPIPFKLNHTGKTNDEYAKILAFGKMGTEDEVHVQYMVSERSTFRRALSTLPVLTQIQLYKAALEEADYVHTVVHMYQNRIESIDTFEDEDEATFHYMGMVRTCFAKDLQNPQNLTLEEAREFISDVPLGGHIIMLYQTQLRK